MEMLTRLLANKNIFVTWGLAAAAIAFLGAGRTEANRALRYAHPMAVFFLDLDNFKQLNDSRGHDAGDAALKAVAAALKTALRVTDTVARLGGDEFAVVLPEIGRDAVTNAANKVAAALAASLAAFPPVTASIGVAWFVRVDTDFDAMLKAADQLMFEMKRDGKGGVCLRAFE